MRVVKITSESIKLGQLLKFLGLVYTGGETKEFLAENTIFLNKIPENRRGKQLFPGDLIEIGKEKYLIELENVDKGTENI